jgi:hypothetical protein
MILTLPMDESLTEPIDAREAQWKKVIERQAQLQTALQQKLQQDILAEFEKIKARVQKIDQDLVERGGKGIGVTVSEQFVQFSNTNIAFHYRSNDDSSGMSSSIQVTQGKRGPIEYFGVRSRNGEITWQIASGTVIFMTDQLLQMLI